MDAETFEERVLAIEPLLYRISCAYLRQEADRADAVQDALMRAWSKRSSLRDPERFQSWVVRILINCCKETLRKQKHHAHDPLDPEWIGNDPPTGPTPLREALSKLNPESRLVITLHYTDGYSVEQISHLLSCPTGTVKSRMRAARLKLRDMMNMEWSDEE